MRRQLLAEGVPPGDVDKQLDDLLPVRTDDALRQLGAKRYNIVATNVSFGGCAGSSGRIARKPPFFLYLAQRNADFLIAVKHGRRQGFLLIRDRFTYGRRAPWQTSHREVKRGRDITWSIRAMPAPETVVELWPGSATIISVRSNGIREDKPQDETRYYVSSLRSGAKTLLRTIRQRWSIENSWHWVRDVPLREDAHRYREFNGVQILATLRSLAINALRLDGFWSITEGIAALAHDIEGLLRQMGWREPAGIPSG